MKNLGIFFVLALVATAFTAVGQGVIKNTNYDPENGVDAPIFCAGGLVALEGPDWVAQLWANGQPLSDPRPFGTGLKAGYWQAPEEEIELGVVVPGIAPGEITEVAVYVWDSSLYTSLEDAIVSLTLHDTLGFMSFQLVVGDPGNVEAGILPTPAPLIGLKSFSNNWNSLSGADGPPCGFSGELEVRVTPLSSTLLIGSGIDWNYQLVRSGDLEVWKVVRTVIGREDGLPINLSSERGKSQFFALRKRPGLEFVDELIAHWEAQRLRNYDFSFSGMSPIDYESVLDFRIQVRAGAVVGVDGIWKRDFLIDDVLEFEEVAVSGVVGFEDMTISGIYRSLHARAHDGLLGKIVFPSTDFQSP